MSRIGRLPVEIPGGVDVTINGREVSVKGPKGSLALELAPPIEISREDSTLKVTRPNDEGKVRALHGLSRTLVANMVTGVTEGYSKTLEIVGVGYRVQARGLEPRVRPGLQPPGDGHAAGRDHIPRRDPHAACR